MKILFLSIKAGAGHNAIAQNLSQKFTDNGHEVKIREMYADNKLNNYIIGGIGLKIMFAMPHIANHFYKKIKKTDKHLYFSLNKRVKKQTLDIINSFAPDVIISTHVAGYIFVKSYGGEIKKPVLSYLISTDYEVTPGTADYRPNEYVIVANDDFVAPLVDKGFAPDHILPYGIPVRQALLRQLTKRQALDELQLDFSEDKLTVLAMGKKDGIGKTYKVAKELSKYEDLQLLVACGTNLKLKKKVDKLAAKSAARIYSYQFNNEYVLTLADVIIGKTGGLSSSEALNTRTPIIALDYAPNPEQSNLYYLEDKGVAAKLDKIKNIYYLVKSLDLKSMQQNCACVMASDTNDLIYRHVVARFEKEQQ